MDQQENSSDTFAFVHTYFCCPNLTFVFVPARNKTVIDVGTDILLTVFVSEKLGQAVD